MKTFILLLILTPIICFAQEYPAEWFKEVPRSEAASWEILPQDAKPGEVILSKRTELGIFSNFGATPFVLEGKSFASVEGLWQSLKYPDPEVTSDERHRISFPHTRLEVENMIGFEAKDAGSAANKIYRENKLKNISWGDRFFDYQDLASGSEFHYQLIRRALRAKLDQNPALWTLLLQTGCLKLRPDHKPGDADPPAYHYYDIFMDLRKERQTVACL